METTYFGSFLPRYFGTVVPGYNPSNHIFLNAGVLTAPSAADCRRYAVAMLKISLRRFTDGVLAAWNRLGDEF